MNGDEDVPAAASSDIFGDADDISSGSDAEAEKKVSRKVNPDEAETKDEDDDAMQVYFNYDFTI